MGHETVNSETQLTYTVEGALYEKEALDLSITDATGNGKALEATLNDNGGNSESVKTQVTISYYTKAALFYRLRYSGNVPQDALVQEGNSFKIRVGQLPIKSSYLSSGERALIALKVTRTYGKYQGSTDLERKYDIP